MFLTPFRSDPVPFLEDYRISFRNAKGKSLDGWSRGRKRKLGRSIQILARRLCNLVEGDG
jgi:hypothetical protein